MIQLSNSENIYGNKAFLFKFWFLLNHFLGQCCFSIPPENNLILVKMSPKMQLKQSFREVEVGHAGYPNMDV